MIQPVFDITCNNVMNLKYHFKRIMTHDDGHIGTLPPILSYRSTGSMTYA